MLYSVWNQGASSYDYYESSSPQQALNVEKPSHLVSRTLGSTVDQAGWPLPASAVHVGMGPDAIGRVATRGSSSSLGDTDQSSLVKAGLLLLSGVLLWKYVVKAPRRRHA